MRIRMCVCVCVCVCVCTTHDVHKAVNFTNQSLFYTTFGHVGQNKLSVQIVVSERFNTLSVQIVVSEIQ